MYSYEPLHLADQKQDGQLEHTYNSYVSIGDVALKTCQRRWTKGRSGERGSEISVLAAWHDDDDDDDDDDILVKRPQFAKNIRRTNTVIHQTSGSLFLNFSLSGTY